MSILLNEKCIACRRDSPRVTEAEIRELKPQVPDWALVERETIQRLERVFRFRNFAEALSFTNRVGSLAEAEGHHPAILTEWGQVTVTLWTHKIRSLHRNDFIMAAKVDSSPCYPDGVRPLLDVGDGVADQADKTGIRLRSLRLAIYGRTSIS